MCLSSILIIWISAGRGLQLPLSFLTIHVFASLFADPRKLKLVAPVKPIKKLVWNHWKIMNNQHFIINNTAM